MYPNYRYRSSTQYSLSKDDVLGIQTLYGEEQIIYIKLLFAQKLTCRECYSITWSVLYVFFSGKPTKKGETEQAPKKCDPNFSFDAATMIGNEIVFFKNRYSTV